MTAKRRENLVKQLVAMRDLDKDDNGKRWLSATIVLAATVSDREYRTIKSDVSALEARYDRAGQTLI